MRRVVSLTPNPQPGGPGYPSFVWVITLDLFGMGGPTSSIRYRQHSSRDHTNIQAPPLHQIRNTFGGKFKTERRTVISPVVLYGYETWSLTFREERRLRMSENRALRRIFGLKRDEVTGEWRKLHNEELNDLYSA
jgi:hypothetical protein